MSVSVRRTASLVSVLALSLVVGCDDPEAAGSAEGTTGASNEASQGDVDTSGGTETGDPGGSSTGEGEGATPSYEVRGRVAQSVGAAAPTPGLTPAGQTQPFEDCPFDPESEPCTSEVCEVDSGSPECIEVVNQYCDENPKDPGCESEPQPPKTPDVYYDPSSLSLLVHKVEFSLDAEGCTDPIVVGEPAEPHYVDFTDGPELIDALAPPDGVYPCVIITMSDHIQWSVEGDNPCAGTALQDVGGESGVEELVRLHLSTEGNSEDGDLDAFSAPGLRLAQPLEVGEGVAGSELVVAFPGGVRYREGSDFECDLAKPEFSFETTYE